MEHFDHLIIGGGIVGLATADALRRRHPDATIGVVEKESRVGRHQTGHNSGVLHSGIYYMPGSLKARLCVSGRRTMVEWCARHGIETRISGKVVVATHDNQRDRLDDIHQRALANGVSGVEPLDRAGIAEYEPHATGVAALWVPETGVVDFGMVAAALAEQLIRNGVVVRTGVAVVGADRSTTVKLDLSDGTAVTAARVVSCGGLHSDVLTRRLGLDSDVKIIPFRGEYWHLRRPDLVRSLIYPVPDPRFPFLGVHFTKGIHDAVEVGPNAVLALAREGYSWRNIDLRHVSEIARFGGTRVLARRYWKTGSAEILRSIIKPLLARDARRLLPDVTSRDLVRAGAGVRAQAVAPDGTLVDDFVVIDDGEVAAVLNAPSPAATASFAIADELVSRLS